MRISRRWLTVIAAAAGLLIASSPVTTAQAAVGDSSQICLTNAPKYCIHSNGPGQQVTITNVDAQKSNFTVVYDLRGIHSWQNGNGNCLREGSDGTVKIANGPCVGSDQSATWGRTGDTYWNELYQGYMFTYGTQNGDKVRATVDPPSGAWVTWNVPT